MAGHIFGLDFGTTNSLVTIIQGGRAVSLADRNTNRPHPSVVWYRGSEVVVGAEARAHLDRVDGGTAAGFLRSPKTLLRGDDPVHIEGRRVGPAEAVAQVLKHLRQDAALARPGGKPYALDHAVLTVPVDFGGVQRRALREAARKAGISVVQFVHEPVAALYGYLRSMPNRDRHLAEHEGRLMLVFDWGGGTLDLTLCRLMGGTLMQVGSAGANDIGGDVFDEALRNLVRRRHAAEHGIDNLLALEAPGMGARLLAQCELAKIELSAEGKNRTRVYVKDYLRIDGKARDLHVILDQADIEREGELLVRKGLAMIDKILEDNRLTHAGVAFCLPTGGMVNMPAIRRGLVERFGALAPKLDNGDRIISEGAAWIAHDELRLTLAKPIEVRVADGSGSGHYFELVGKGIQLPVENEKKAVANKQFVCADPRNGVAVFEFAKPKAVGLVTPENERERLGAIMLAVDPNAHPLMERLSCEIQIDHDYIATAYVQSGNRGAKSQAEFHRLDFGLAIGNATGQAATNPGSGDEAKSVASAKGSARISADTDAVAFRPNVAPAERWQQDRSIVAGDLAYELWPSMFDRNQPQATQHQLAEQNYYRKCGPCQRTAYEIEALGPIEECDGRPCYPRGWPRRATPEGSGSGERMDG